MKDLTNINNNHEFEDIEQLLQPQCDFHASSQTKKEVMEKARKSMTIYRSLRIFPWICAACVAGIITIILMPPKSTTSSVSNMEVTAKAEMGRTFPQPNRQDNEAVKTEEQTLLQKKPAGSKKKMTIKSSKRTPLPQKASLSKLPIEENEIALKEDVEEKNNKETKLIPMTTLDTENLIVMETRESLPHTYQATNKQQVDHVQKKIIVNL